MSRSSGELFSTLLELIECPDDPRAKRLREHFECASIAELLRPVMTTENGLDLQREIEKVLRSK